MAAELAARLSRAEPSLSVPRSAGWSASRVWSAVWPKLGALAITLIVWQLVVWTGWKSQSALPGPWPVLTRLGDDLHHLEFYAGVAATLRRAALGYAVAAAAGVLVTIVIARITLVRRAVGSLLVGLQSMPSIVWLPLAILLLQHSEGAITVVVLMGAAPAIAGGLLAGIDHVQPALIRVGRAMGAEGLVLYRHVILPAALPAFVTGLKQGWALAWRSLMSAELLLAAGNQASIGLQLQAARNLSDMRQLLALLVVIFVIGALVDAVFGALEGTVRRRWGLGGEE